jgi:hypothetical protein
MLKPEGATSLRYRILSEAYLIGQWSEISRGQCRSVDGAWQLLNGRV